MFLSVIIAAGGTGTRMRLGRSKQLADLAGRPVLARTLAVFDAHEAVRQIVVAIDADDIELCRAEIVEKFCFAKITAVVPGADSRAGSVRNALAALDPAADTVAVHDGARPLFPGELLTAGLEMLAGEAIDGGSEAIDGVVFGVPVIDTVKETDAGGFIIGTPDRSRLWAAQTPQIFSRRLLEKAYAQPAALARATDDAQLVELAGGRVKMVMGSHENIKLTTPTDMLVAAEIIRRQG